MSEPTDLSMRHEPVSDFLTLPSSVERWNEYRLTDEQVEFFHTNGYVSGIRVLSDEQVEQLRSELAELTQPNYASRELFHEFNSNESADPSKVLFHALGAWRTSPGFHDMLWSPGFTVPASQLLNGSVRFWHDQLFCKPSHHGGVVAWHQDYSYWTRTQPMQHLTCWIGLDDATTENGCLQYVPGSHNWELLPITGLAGDMEAIREVLDDTQWNQLQNPTPIELKKGEATFHHPLMVHGSRDNRSDRERRATVINAFLDGVKSHSAEPLLDGMPPIEPGKQIDGQFFPLLFDPTKIG